MAAAHIFERSLLTDGVLLDYLWQTAHPDLAHMERLLWVQVRNQNPQDPDYRHDGHFRMAFPKGLKVYGKNLFDAFNELTRDNFRFYRGGLFIHGPHLYRWQNLLTHMMPLPLIAMGIFRRYQAGQQALSQTRENLGGACTLPSIFHPLLEDFIRNEGLNELHIHLNGTTEAAWVWQDALRKPLSFVSAVQGAFQKNNVKLHWLQLLPNGNPFTLYNMLRVACYLRGKILAAMTQTSSGDRQPKFHQMAPRDWIHHGRLDQPRFDHLGTQHPVSLLVRRGYLIDQPALLNRPAQQLSPIQAETWLWVRIFKALKGGASLFFARDVHLYSLIGSLFNRFLVQQENQWGFDQFQKITLHDFREFSERTYGQRFRQLEGFYHQDLAFLEGRFAPSSKGKKMFGLLRRIVGDYERYRQIRRETSPPTTDHHPSFQNGPADVVGIKPHERSKVSATTPKEHGWEPAASEDAFIDTKDPRAHKRPMALRLVAHFIKKKPSATYGVCRFYRLRRDLTRQLRRLINITRCYPKIGRYLSGFDAAANEMHTPPEVFAPLFRSARRAGWSNFTFHAGEDDVHLVGGIRRVYEALRFLNLGDEGKGRIGHATALGIDPAHYLRHTPAEMVLRCGDWLDNLVFVSSVLQHRPEFIQYNSPVASQKQALFQQIYDHDGRFQFTNIGPLLEQAWHLRHLDASLLSDLNLRLLESGSKPDLSGYLSTLKHALRCENNPGQKEEWRLFLEAAEKTPLAFTFWVDHYHRQETLERGNRLIRVERDFFGPDVLQALQEFVLAELIGRNVAIESMPISNLRISHYKHFHEHHLFRWLGLATNPTIHRPLVVLASDDPGIFANNCRADHALVFQTLVGHYGKSEKEAINILRDLNHNARAYRFD